MSQENARVKAGFGLPLDHADYAGDAGLWSSEYLSAVQSWKHEAMSIRDLCMLAFVNSITDKPDWTHKVFEEDIVAKWKVEVMGMNWEKAGINNGDMSEAMFEHCMKELHDKAAFYEKYGMVPVLDVTATVVKSDSILTEILTDALRAAVNPLEDVPDTKKGWHLGSDGKILNLVHPSLYPGLRPFPYPAIW